MASYGMAQRAGGGYNFTDPSGRSISALGYARGSGTDFYDLLHRMSASGDRGAGAFIHGFIAGPGTGADDRATASNLGFNTSYAYPGMGDIGRALTWRDSPPSVQGAVTGGGGGNVDPGLVNRAYDTKIAGLRSLMDTLQPQQDAANLNVQNQFTNQSNTLQSQRAIGQRNLGIASEQVQAGKVKGLADLRRQVETQGRSYANQLGAYGAGDSSAAGLISQALSGLASRNRAGVLENASTQDRAIKLQGEDLETDFGNQMRTLDDWKNGTLNDIATRFLQQRQQIQQQMITADADRYQALAQIDDAYTRQAMVQLAALEGQYQRGAQELVAQYQNVRGPQVAIAPNLQQFAVSPIEAGRIEQMRMVPAVNQGNQPTPLALRRPFEEDFGLGFSPSGV